MANFYDRSDKVTSRKKQIRVAIDARIIHGTAGGVENVILGLASGLSKLGMTNESYSFLSYGSSSEWLEPYVYGPCRILPIKESLEIRLKRLYLHLTPILRRDVQNTLIGMLNVAKGTSSIPISNGVIEKHNIDVMHFLRQDGFLTRIPSIYHPHDLLHIHYPGLFGENEINRRTEKYRAFCAAATIIAVTSSWVKEDLVKIFKVSESKVKVIPFAPALTDYPVPDATSIMDVRSKYALPGQFLLYPAQTWPHKNHETLLRALHLIKVQKHKSLPLVCTGALNEFIRYLKRVLKELELEDSVQFLGFIDPVDLRTIYSLARVVVVPSKFEAASGPIWEAFMTGVPVASSNVTSLPRQVGDAGLLFDPDSPLEIADAIERLWFDEELRERLITRGKEKVGHFSWEKTAQHFRAYYRLIAGKQLSDEDINIMQADPQI